MLRRLMPQSVDFMNQVVPKDRVYGYLNVHR